jgi:hypothetical protein
VDQTTAFDPSASTKLISEKLTLNGLSVAVVTLPYPVRPGGQFETTVFSRFRLPVHARQVSPLALGYPVT